MHNPVQLTYWIMMIACSIVVGTCIVYGTYKFIQISDAILRMEKKLDDRSRD
jgi:hypothetical protein